MKSRQRAFATLACFCIATIGIYLAPTALADGGEAMQSAGAGTLSPQQLDALIAAQPGAREQQADDNSAAFLRRVSFDLIGRPPTTEEQQAFATRDSSSTRWRSLPR